MNTNEHDLPTEYNRQEFDCQDTDELRTERGGHTSFHAVEYVDWGALELEVGGVEERR